MAVEVPGGKQDVTVLQLKILGGALARHYGQAESKAVSRVSHFYTFFELSLVLLTTHAHGL